jgi:DivIVA domain-containing protein
MARKKQKKGKEEELATLAEPRRITPVDIQQKEFRVAMRGYHEQDVDQFLDDVTEEVARLYAENKRLREELEFAGTRRVDVGGAQEAEAILRGARDEADRLLAEARARAAVESARLDPAGTAGSRSAPADLGPFITREREFLQGLADLIQSHAEAVKQQLRKSRQVEAHHEPGITASQPVSGRDTEASTQAWTMAPEPQANGASEAVPPETGPPLDPAGGSSLEDRAEAEIAGQDWTQYYSGPTVPPRPSGSFAAVESDDEILDLTGAARSDEDDAEDRSLRELFWGED